MPNYYTPTDVLFLWWLSQPAQPLYVGELHLVRTLQGVSLQYSDAWRAHGFSLSEDLPLTPQELLPTEKETAVGAVDDARPDRWGERLIRIFDRPSRLSVLEFLYFAGDERFGALGVSTSSSAYTPCAKGPLPTLADADAIHELVRKVLANEALAPQERQLIAPSGTVGGAKPKALININQEQWILKFDAGDPTDTPLVEHAAMTLARKAGIRVAETMPIRLTHGHAVGIKRFDRHKSQRLHALSAHVILRAAGEQPGYPELAQVLRRRGVAAKHIAQMHELFRRMVFNILIDNTDDHEKNHAVLMSDAFEYNLSPAYDILPSGQALGFQQMRVGEMQADSTLSNALSSCTMFALKKNEAVQEIKRVAGVIARWKKHFRQCGVSANDIDVYAEHIDRPFLRDQRREFETQ